MPRRSSFVASVLALLSCLLSGAWAQDSLRGTVLRYVYQRRSSATQHPTAAARTPSWRHVPPLCRLAYSPWPPFEFAQMDQIISVVGEVYSMQLEVDAAIRAITVRPGLRFLESVWPVL